MFIYKTVPIRIAEKLTLAGWKAILAPNQDGNVLMELDKCECQDSDGNIMYGGCAQCGPNE